MLSRIKPAVDTHKFQSVKTLPKFEDFVGKRDYTGALTFLEVSIGSCLNLLTEQSSFVLTFFTLQFKKTSKTDVEIELWMGFCAFHLGDYKRAMEIYKKLYEHDKNIPNVAYNLACCYFYLGRIKLLLCVVYSSAHLYSFNYFLLKF